MPKDTFFNLPEEKRSLILQVAIEEFAKYSFNQASINRIVSRSGIAKGSFYQYFEDKIDLFKYLIQVIASEKIKYLSPVMQNPDNYDFFTLLREMNLSGLRFAADHPHFDRVRARIMESRNSPIYHELLADNLPSAYGFYEKLLQDGVQRGEIRANIDIKMFAYLITSMNALLVDYYLDYVAQELDENIMQTIDSFIDFLKNGIGNSTIVPPP